MMRFCSASTERIFSASRSPRDGNAVPCAFGGYRFIWIPLFFLNNYQLDIKDTAIFAAGVFLGGVVGDTVGGVLSDSIYHRTGNLRLARLSIIILGFVGALLSLLPLF